MIDSNMYETVPAEWDNFPLRVREYLKPAKFCTHWHGHTELLYFIKGGGSINCGGEEIAVKDKDLIIINTNEMHRGDFGKSSVHYYCIMLPQRFFEWTGEEERCIFRHLIEGDEYVGETVCEIFRCFAEKEPGYRYATLAYAYSLFSYLIKNYAECTLSRNEYAERNGKLENFNRVIDHIQKNYAENLTTAAAANMAHMSKYYFCHQFKKYTGKSLTAYLAEVRVQKAAAMLENTRLGITEIASEVGFDDANYFSRVFKRIMGKSPKNYRMI